MNDEADVAEYGWKINSNFLNQLRARASQIEKDEGILLLDLNIIHGLLMALDEYLYWKNQL